MSTMSLEQACTAAGITYHQGRYWTRRPRPLWQPTHRLTNRSRTFTVNPDELGVAIAVRELRDAGLSVQKIRAVWQAGGVPVRFRDWPAGDLRRVLAGYVSSSDDWAAVAAGLDVWGRQRGLWT